MKRIHLYRRVILYWKLVKESIISFADKDILTHAAAISYYTVFSLPSMLLIVLWTAAQFYREDAVHEAIFEKVTELLGKQASDQIMSTIQQMSIEEPTWFSTTIAIGILLFFATTVFDAMRTALNTIDKVKAPSSLKKNIWMLLRLRIIGFALLISISFFLLVSLTLDVMLSTLSIYLFDWLGEWSKYFLLLDKFLLDFFATTLIFALYFRYLPDIRLKWSVVFFGAGWTSVLFVAGKGLIALLISNNQIVDLYDAAGSLLILMLWVYYASIIFLFGATFTFSYASKKDLMEKQGKD
ncbi:MAG: hypothetical protein B6D54_02825 [Epsilonproteobacteria bacterium 4484_65]|nr:MAG: hypothetical protein B6D54_02825 [Epsilonproteobacteria bacterium 4484_65]HEC45185.1 YihY/virulence factor BrkB family protein [Campylobacterota bacterium]